LKKIAMFVLIALAPMSVFAAEPVTISKSTRDKALTDYAMITRDAIQTSWTTPLRLDAPDAVKGKMMVNYIIRKNGDLEKLELIKGSGIPEMDSSLLAAIRAAAPFPAFPAGIHAKRILIKANFIVADMPTAPAAQAKHEFTRTVQDDLEASRVKKYVWGIAAGAAAPTPSPAQDQSLPAPPASREFKWGLERVH
jgi:TonB family protein